LPASTVFETVCASFDRPPSVCDTTEIVIPPENTFARHLELFIAAVILLGLAGFIISTVYKRCLQKEYHTQMMREVNAQIGKYIEFRDEGKHEDANV